MNSKKRSAINMKLSMIIILITFVLMDFTDGQYPNCVKNCPDGSMALSPLSYNTMRSNVFNGTQPSNEGCTNGVSIDGQVTIDCGQETTLIDCDRGLNRGDYSDLSNTFTWNRTTSVAQQVSIVFRFDQQIKISRITMFFLNSQSNSIIIPNVMMYWSNDDSITPSNEITIITNSPSRTGDGRRKVNIDVINDRLTYQYLKIVMNFYNKSEWIFLGEVQFCGSAAPYYITQPSTNNYVQIAFPNATNVTLSCSLNINIPIGMTITWLHNGSVINMTTQGDQTTNTTQLTRTGTELQSGVYQCVFTDTTGYILGRNITLLVQTSTVTSSAVTTVATTLMSMSNSTITSSATTTSILTATSTSSVTTTTTTTTTTIITTDETLSSSDVNVGVIAAPIIIIIVIALVVVALIIAFYWWRRKKQLHSIYNEAVTLSAVNPYYTKEKDTTDGTHVTSENTYVNQQPLPVYAIPDKQKRKSAEVQRSIVDFDHNLQHSPEMSVRSQMVTLPSITSDYEHDMELDIYAAPDLPECTEASSIMFGSTDEIYSEAINPTVIIDGISYDSISDNDSLCPYSSIYADPLPLTKSEGPPIVSNKNIEPLNQLGTGRFGEVMLANTVGLSYQYLGIGNNNDSTVSMKVAVKTLKSSPSEDVQKAFEKEIKFMSRLKDDNVIRLLGICTTGTPFIMMEYMENGDLNNYLQQFEFTNKTENPPAENEIRLDALVYMSYQIASGMNYLSSCKFIHRDLAARNILVGVDYTVKIADFGMSQNLYSAYYYKMGGRICLPIRWMAYECFFGKFSVKTDVWAFGITLWEIFTLCRFQPFIELSDQEMIQDATKGAKRKIPYQPAICPNDIYEIMKSCFHHEPSERAEFNVLCDQLNECYSNILTFVCET